MREFTSYIKHILDLQGIQAQEKALPYELLIKNFSNENGVRMLSPWFGKIITREISGALLFRNGDIHDFERYFMRKRSFFVPGSGKEQEENARRVLDFIKKDFKVKKELRIGKEDVIYICSEPLPQ
jgi:hypothetical protein